MMVFIGNRINQMFRTIEENIIQNIMYNNTFPIQPHKPPTSKPPTSELHRKIATTTHTPTHKWVTFTYTGKPVQKDHLKNCISNQQYYPEFTKAQTTGTRHIHKIRSVQTEVPRL